MSELMLKTIKADGRGYHEAAQEFVWPGVGEIAEAPDWDPKPMCGGGLHGLLRGVGDGTLLNWSPDAIWLAVEIDEWVDLDGKIKAPRGKVVARGKREDVTNLLVARYPSLPVVGAIATAGDRGTATAGYRGTATASYRGTATAGDWGTATASYRGTATAGDWGTATAGYRGTATAGYRGTATAGYSGTATAGDRGTATAGDSGTATAGDSGTATAGDRGTATAGYRGTATAGDSGTATAGYRGTATAGDRGTATAGDRGTAMAGDWGILQIKWWGGEQYRIATAYVGENGIKPNTPYRLDAKDKFVEVEKTAILTSASEKIEREE